jgi:hypothetical protein
LLPEPSLCAIIEDVRLIAFIAVAYVLGLNCTVRHFGGDAFPLSVVRLPEKTQAVVMLGLHSVKHLWNDHCDDPQQYVMEAAREKGVPVSFALSIARTESNFRSHSISSTGAMGVMQLMPNTARENGVMDPFDPQDNARGAVNYLSTLWKRYRGNRMRIAAAYNAGPGRVAQKGALQIPRETQGYAKRVLARDKGRAIAMNDQDRATPAAPATAASATPH